MKLLEEKSNLVLAPLDSIDYSETCNHMSLAVSEPSTNHAKCSVTYIGS